MPCATAARRLLFRKQLYRSSLVTIRSLVYISNHFRCKQSLIVLCR